MKILHLSSARGYGGGERHLSDLIEALGARGHQVLVAAPPGSPLGKRLSLAGSGQFVALRFRHVFAFEAARRLARLIREQEIEIVHAHLGRDYLTAAMAVRFAGRATPVKLVLTRHVMFPLGEIHRLTFRQAARVVAVSEAVAANLRAQELCPPDKIDVIKNGIALESLMVRSDSAVFRRQSGARPSQLLIGMCGELSVVKGQEDFLRAAALVAKEFPEAMFLIAGEDVAKRGEYRRHLENLTRELGLDERVRLLGWVESVPLYLNALDLFVSASRSESFGLAMVEAMASALPVIATRTDGAREIIADGDTGILTPIGGITEMAKAIGALLRDPDARTRLGTNARQSALDKFSLARMADETERLYAEVAGER